MFKVIKARSRYITNFQCWALVNKTRSKLRFSESTRKYGRATGALHGAVEISSVNQAKIGLTLDFNTPIGRARELLVENASLDAWQMSYLHNISNR